MKPALIPETIKHKNIFVVKKKNKRSETFFTHKNRELTHICKLVNGID